MATARFVGVVGGSVGTEPFHRRTWSGSSYYLFSALQCRGNLYRAFGGAPSSLLNRFFQARNYSRSRELWRRHYYMDRSYRDALTRAMQKRLEPGDLPHPFFQIGAMFNMREALGPDRKCYSYHDGTIMDYLRSPFAPKALSRRRIDEAVRYEHEVYASMTRILTMSEFHRQSIIHDFDIPPERVVNVGYGANLDQIPPCLGAKDYGTGEILFVGADFERKGGPGLLRAFRKVRESYPNAKLHIVGPPALDVPPALGHGVVHHGFLSRMVPAEKAQLDELYRRCVLFVLPSLREGVGISCVESMLHRLPCVVSNGWGLPESVIPGETGDLVEPGDVDGLAESLCRLLGDPPALRRMGESGRKMALDVFSWPKVADRIVAATNEELEILQ